MPNQRRLLPALAAIALAASGGHAAASDHSRNGRIAWSRLSGDRGPAQIVTARPDGSDLRVLTQPPAGASDLDAQWSPDGTRILFGREYADRVEIVVMNADGRRQRVVDFGCSDPCVSDQGATWAPDGRHIAFTRVIGPFDGPNGEARSAALWTGRDDGTHVRRLSPLDIDRDHLEDGLARWAPDGAYIQFRRTRSAPGIDAAILRMRPDGSGARQLTPWELNAGNNDLSPATSGPTEDLVVFETGQNIATVPATCPTLVRCAAQLRSLTSTTGSTRSADPAWAPDGSRIAFAEATFPAPGDTSTDWYPDIFTMDARGRDRRLVSRGAEWSFHPDWGVARPARRVEDSPV